MTSNHPNPFVQTCINIARNGCQKQGAAGVAVPYYNPKLQELGRFLLTRSGCPQDSCQNICGPHSYKSIALCFGAGIDSYCALILALQLEHNPIHVVHVHYGQPYYDEEQFVVNRIFSAYPSAMKQDLNRFPGWQNRLKLEDGGNDSNEGFYADIGLVNEGLDWENYIIPARNLVLAAIASQYSNHVWVVANSRANEAVGTPDKTKHFFQTTVEIMTQFYGSKYIFGSPFSTQSKLRVVQNYLQAGGSIEALKETVSCYSPSKGDIIHCGKCYACYKRFKLFQALNVEHNFVVHPQSAPNWNAYEAREAKKHGV